MKTLKMVLNGDVASMKNIFRNINKSLTEEDMLMLSPLQLAYVGDGVYELFIRTYLLDQKSPVNIINRRARGLVKAESQARILSALERFLTEEEKKIVRRGRNAKTHSSPKNADIMDYKYSTGFEALIGHLYIRGMDKRLIQIMEKILFSDLVLILAGEIKATKGLKISRDIAKLKDLFRSESIDPDRVLIREDGSGSFILRSVFPTDIVGYETQEKKIYKLFNRYIKEEGMSFNGGLSLEFKENIDEG